MNKIFQENVHVILVEPSEPLNVGSVARAMTNLGFVNLHLVNPKNYQPERAAITACWADDLLRSLIRHDSLEGALGTMQHVVAFSGRVEKSAPDYISLIEWVTFLLREPPVPTAMVFGPEDNGLRQEHLALCRWVVHLPGVGDYQSFNLAQAVLLALYELRRAVSTAPSEPSTTGRELPSWNEYYHLDRLLQQIGERTGFYRDGTPAPVPHLMKKLVRRMDPDLHEMKVLLAFFNRLDSVLSGKIPPQ